MSCCQEKNDKIAALLVALAQAELRCPRRLDIEIIDRANLIHKLQAKLSDINKQLKEANDNRDYWKNRAFEAEARLSSSESPSESDESDDEEN